MFKKIGRSLALQFTLFVFLLFMLNGMIFLVADLGNDIRQTRMRLAEEMSYVQSRLADVMNGVGEIPLLPHPERLRVVDAVGMTIYGGELFADIPLERDEGFSVWTIGREEFIVLTDSIMQDGEVIGTVQIAEPEHASIGDLPLRAFVYMLVSILISLLTYVVGRHFAKMSLKPAEEMFVRLERFTQDASHELRTPLAVLGSSLDLALKTKEYREGIVSAKEDLKKISGLVEKLLELARSGTQALEHKTLDLSSLVRDSVESIRPLATEAGIRLDLRLETDVCVKGDGGLLHQVLSNLLSNAIKFTRPNGTINVTLTRKALRVEDTGIGIAERDLPHLFERFYQADDSRSKGGFGLGLSLVKQIVDLHGWTIGVESVREKGSTFTIGFGKNNHRIS